MTASPPFDDPFALVVDVTQDDYNERRYKLIGRPILSRDIVLMIVFTERWPDVCRLISARRADPEDVGDYYSRFPGR